MRQGTRQARTPVRDSGSKRTACALAPSERAPENTPGIVRPRAIGPADGTGHNEQWRRGGDLGENTKVQGSPAGKSREPNKRRKRPEFSSSFPARLEACFPRVFLDRSSLLSKSSTAKFPSPVIPILLPRFCPDSDNSRCVRRARTTCRDAAACARGSALSAGRDRRTSAAALENATTTWHGGAQASGKSEAAQRRVGATRRRAAQSGSGAERWRARAARKRRRKRWRREQRNRGGAWRRGGASGGGASGRAAQARALGERRRCA